jgi:hypothetical protein
MPSTKMQTEMKALRVGSVFVGLAASAMLIGAVASWPYSYYTAIRWITLAAVGLLVFRGNQLRLRWPWGLVVVGVIFNPLIPLHLSRNVWAVLDVIGAACLLASVVGMEWPEIVRGYRAGGSQRRRLLLLLAGVLLAYAGAVVALLLAPDPPRSRTHSRYRARSYRTTQTFNLKGNRP